MTLLDQLEREFARVQDQLRQLTRERTVLREQITRLRTGTPPEVACAALQVALGSRPDLCVLGDGGDGDRAASPGERVVAARGNGRDAVLDGRRRLRTPKTAA
jgi:hypothetical protein